MPSPSRHTWGSTHSKEIMRTQLSLYISVGDWLGQCAICTRGHTNNTTNSEIVGRWSLHQWISFPFHQSDCAKSSTLQKELILQILHILLLEDVHILILYIPFLKRCYLVKINIYARSDVIFQQRIKKYPWLVHDLMVWAFLFSDLNFFFLSFFSLDEKIKVCYTV